MASSETIYVDTPKISCDGGTRALGHPKIYLDMEGKEALDCPYCGRHFILTHQGTH